jgi:hypothetical protein
MDLSENVLNLIYLRRTIAGAAFLTPGDFVTKVQSGPGNSDIEVPACQFGP